MWKLSIQQIPLGLTKPQFKHALGSSTSLSYYSFFAYFLMKGGVIPEFKAFAKSLKD